MKQTVKFTALLNALLLVLSSGPAPLSYASESYAVTGVTSAQPEVPATTVPNGTVAASPQSGTGSATQTESDSPLSSPTAADEDPVGDYIEQFRDSDGRLRRQEMARNLEERGDAEFAARVIVRYAYDEYISENRRRGGGGVGDPGPIRYFENVEFVRAVEAELSGPTSSNPIWSQYNLSQHQGMFFTITYAIGSTLDLRIRELTGDDSWSTNPNDSSENQNPRSEAQALIGQYRGRNGVVRYNQLSQALLDLTTRRGAVAARVLAELAVASYRRSGRVNTELISFLDNFNLLRRIRSIFDENRFWRTYALSPTELHAVRSAFRTRINEQTVQTLVRHHDGVYTPDRQRIVFHHQDGVIDFVGTYDVRTKNIFSRSLEGINGYRGIRGVTPDGNYALVASRTNAGVYVVPLYTVNNFGPRFFTLPTSSAVEEVSFIPGQNVVRIRLRSGRSYRLNYLTGEVIRDLVGGSLSRAAY